MEHGTLYVFFENKKVEENINKVVPNAALKRHFYDNPIRVIVHCATSP